MTLLLDASAVVEALLGTDRGERLLERLVLEEDEPVTVVHLDAEVLSALARLQRAGQLDTRDVERLLAHFRRLAVRRLPITPELLLAAWALRGNVSMRDALYVAAARALGVGLLTTDERLARAVPDVAVEH